MDIDSDRPLKRQKIVANADFTEQPEAPPPSPLPLPILLLSLPELLLHPPTHRSYHRSLWLSLLALRQLSTIENLDTDLECKMWTSFAECGFRMGFEMLEGLEHEIEKAITKALLLAQNHPTLRFYKVHLTLLSARLSQHQLNFKFSQNTLRRLLTGFLSPQDPPHLVYTSHLGYISTLSIPDSSGVLFPSLKSLGALQDLQGVAQSHGHDDVVKLTAVLRLQTLIQTGQMESVQEALGRVEELLLFPPSNLADMAATFARANRSRNDTAFLIYALLLGAIYYTHVGDSLATESRTKVLHELLDNQGMDVFGSHGILQLSFPNSPPLYVQAAHPQVLMTLAFLVTAVAKRDPVGRKPRRKVFAGEGLARVQRQIEKEPPLPAWASNADLLQYRGRLEKLKADLMCEIVGVCIMRSEFGEAEKTLAELIAHTRNQSIFDYYSGRITLLQAQLSHSLGHVDRALQCYQVAAFLSRKREARGPQPAARPGGDDAMHDDDDGVEDQWTHAAATAGELWVRIGMLRSQVSESGVMSGEYDEEYTLQWEAYVKHQESELKTLAKRVTAACEGLGGTLAAISCVLKACTTTEFLAAKAHLREALKIVDASNDNHLRALILALVASQYLNTSQEHAEAMLTTAEQLAAGLGAQPRQAKGLKKESGERAGTPGAGDARKIVKPADGVGNAPLRLWIGERSSELKRRVGDEPAARAQEMHNVRLRAAVKRIEGRRSLFVPALTQMPPAVVDQQYSKMAVTVASGAAAATRNTAA